MPWDIPNQQILVPAVDTPREEHFQMLVGNQVIYEANVSLAPQSLHEYADDVDLLMGTGNSRWMFKPSVSLPFSMVQIAPDNEDQTWKAGYEYTIENISGFNHFCDWTIDGFLMQPTCGELKVQPGPEDNPDLGYRSRIDEVAPRCQLAAFKKVMLQPGERKTVEFTLNPRPLAYVDETGCLAEEPGQVMLYVGNVCPSAPQRFTAGLLSKPVQLKGEAKIFMY